MKKAVYVGQITEELKQMGYTETPIEVQVMNTVNTSEGIKASVVLPNGKLANVAHSGVIVKMDESEDVNQILHS